MCVCVRINGVVHSPSSLGDNNKSSLRKCLPLCTSKNMLRSVRLKCNGLVKNLEFTLNEILRALGNVASRCAHKY